MGSEICSAFSTSAGALPLRVPTETAHMVNKKIAIRLAASGVESELVRMK